MHTSVCFALSPARGGKHLTAHPPLPPPKQRSLEARRAPGRSCLLEGPPRSRLAVAASAFFFFGDQHPVMSSVAASYAHAVGAAAAFASTGAPGDVLLDTRLQALDRGIDNLKAQTQALKKLFVTSMQHAHTVLLRVQSSINDLKVSPASAALPPTGSHNGATQSNDVSTRLTECEARLLLLERHSWKQDLCISNTNADIDNLCKAGICHMQDLTRRIDALQLLLSTSVESISSWTADAASVTDQHVEEAR